MATLPEIETERLSLRRLDLSDAPFIVSLLNQPSFLANIGDRGVRDETDALRYLREGPMAMYEKFGFGLPVGQTARQYTRGSVEPGLPAIWVEPATQRLRIEFLRRRQSANPGIRYNIEFSNDLVTWSSGGVILDETTLDTVWERVRFEDEQSLTGEAPQRFVRVKLPHE